MPAKSSSKKGGGAASEEPEKKWTCALCDTEVPERKAVCYCGEPRPANWDIGKDVQLNPPDAADVESTPDPINNSDDAAPSTPEATPAPKQAPPPPMKPKLKMTEVPKSPPQQQKEEKKAPEKIANGVASSSSSSSPKKRKTPSPDEQKTDTTVAVATEAATAATAAPGTVLLPCSTKRITVKLDPKDPDFEMKKLAQLDQYSDDPYFVGNISKDAREIDCEYTTGANPFAKIYHKKYPNRALPLSMFMARLGMSTRINRSGNWRGLKENWDKKHNKFPADEPKSAKRVLEYTFACWNKFNASADGQEHFWAQHTRDVIAAIEWKVFSKLWRQIPAFNDLVTSCRATNKQLIEMMLKTKELKPEDVDMYVLKLAFPKIQSALDDVLEDMDKNERDTSRSRRVFAQNHCFTTHPEFSQRVITEKDTKDEYALEMMKLGVYPVDDVWLTRKGGTIPYDARDIGEDGHMKGKVVQVVLHLKLRNGGKPQRVKGQLVAPGFEMWYSSLKFIKNESQVHILTSVDEPINDVGDDFCVPMHATNLFGMAKDDADATLKQIKATPDYKNNTYGKTQKALSIMPDTIARQIDEYNKKLEADALARANSITDGSEDKVPADKRIKN